MKIERLINQLTELQKSMPGAEVRLHHYTGDVALFALAINQDNAKEDQKNVVWIESTDDIDVGEELSARLNHATEIGMDDNDFLEDLLDTGFSEDDIKTHIPEFFERIS